MASPNKHQTKTRALLRWTSLVFFISHFYRAYKTYFFSLKFSYEHSETSPNFFVYALLYFQNNKCKKNLEIREGSQEQWKHTSTPYIFFFLSLVFSYEHAERFPAFFLCLLSISRIMNAKKNSKSEREVKSNGNTLLTHTFFLFLSLDCSYEHSERFPTIFFHALLVFVQ